MNGGVEETPKPAQRVSSGHAVSVADWLQVFVGELDDLLKSSRSWALHRQRCSPSPSPRAYNSDRCCNDLKAKLIQRLPGARI